MLAKTRYNLYGFSYTIVYYMLNKITPGDIGYRVGG